MQENQDLRRVEVPTENLRTRGGIERTGDLIDRARQHKQTLEATSYMTLLKIVVEEDADLAAYLDDCLHTYLETTDNINPADLLESMRQALMLALFEEADGLYRNLVTSLE